MKYEVYKSSFEDHEEFESIGIFEDPFAVASYLASIPEDHLYIYQVTEWFTGHNGDWPEDAWDHEGSTCGDEWVEDYVKYELDGNENKLLSVGSKVILPDNLKLRKVQKRFCVVDAIRPERGRQYMILRGITSRGVSRSDSQIVYLKLKHIHTLISNGDKYPGYIPVTETYQGK